MTHTRPLELDVKTVFGFWVYLMTDLVLFASLFAMYAVLHANVANGPSGHEVFNGLLALTETLVLLTSSFVVGLTMFAARAHKRELVIAGILLTMFFGVTFLAIEIAEFASLVAAGHSWAQSGFLSAYYVLVGTHGLHIFIGLIWALTLFENIFHKGLSQGNMRKLVLFSLFWHFLDIIWICIFTLVYLLGII
jgi:cytochrome o ubiquinol oxidase subunit 3